METEYLTRLDIRHDWENACDRNKEIKVNTFLKDVYYKMYKMNFNNMEGFDAITKDNLTIQKNDILDKIKESMWDEHSTLSDLDTVMRQIHDWGDTIVKFSFSRKKIIKICDICM